MVPDETTARSISELLLSQKLIACTNIIPIQSIYFWEGSLCKEGEFVIFAKTLHDKVESIERNVIAVHPYEIPLISSWSIEVNEAYWQWVNECLEKP